MTPIQLVASGWDVGPLQEQLAAHPELWDEHRQRTAHYEGPHGEVSDIWVRYRDFAEYTGDMAAFNQPHVSTWYDCVQKIPAAWSLARRVARRMGKKTLGGVLITKIKPGGSVKPHVDGGWHAGHYEKFALQIAGNVEQAFCFEGCELRPVTGDLYAFRNDVLHWVENRSSDPRITLIICAR